MFATATRTPAQKTLDYANSLDPDAEMFMYLEDVYILVVAAFAQQVLKFVRDTFGECGVSVNDSKVKIWSSDPSIIPSSLQSVYCPQLTILKRKLDVPGDAEHQGLPLVNEPQTLEKESERASQLTAELLKLVKAGLDLETAAAMFRAYAGPASQHTLRSCEVAHESAAAYDGVIAQCWSDLLGRQVSVDETRLWLPLRMGGVGACSARVRVFAAPWAAWTSSHQAVSEHVGAEGAEGLFEMVPAIGQKISQLHAKLSEQGTLAVIAHTSPARALTMGATQKALVAHSHKGALRTLRANLDDDAAAFLHSASGQGAGAFLEVPLDDR